MSTQVASTPEFRTLHALKIKGFASAQGVSDLAGNDLPTTTEHLQQLAADGYAQFREPRQLWQITPAGREQHAAGLAADIGDFDVRVLGPAYTEFLVYNDSFKELCGRWQLRDGAINDHANKSYDAAVVASLAELHKGATVVISTFGEHYLRFGPYPDRLQSACERVLAGERNLIAGVLCGSYHDIWMELHEDLLLTQGISRGAEGSA